MDFRKLRHRARQAVGGLVDGRKWQRRIDRLADVVSPQWAAKRQDWRNYLALTHRDGPFAAGNHVLNHATWNASAGSMDEKLLPKLGPIRNRVRELVSNDPHAAAVTRAYVDHVVGSGVSPKPTPNRERLLEAGVTDEQIDNFVRAAESVWREWVPHADSTGQCDFYTLQRLVERRVTEDGDVFINPVMVRNDPSRPYELALEVIVADRVENPADKNAGDLPYTRAGIQRDRLTGRPIKAWVRVQHPGEARYADPSRRNEWRRLVFRGLDGRPRLLQVFDKHEPGQTRGFPVLTPTLPLFALFADTLRAECLAIKVQACFSAFIKKQDSASAWSKKGNGSTRADGQRSARLEAGTMEFLQPGEDVSFGNPTRPGGTFEPYVLRLLKTMAAGAGISYELISRDWTNTTYTSGRMAGLESKRVFLTRHENRVNAFYSPVWCWLIEEAVLANKLKAPKWSKLRDAWCGVQWHHRQGWPMVDPEKDIRSKELAIKLGLSSRRIECAELGRDPDAILRDEALDEQMRDEILPKREPAPSLTPDLQDPQAPGEDDPSVPPDGNVEDAANDAPRPVQPQRPKEVIPT